MTNTSGWFMLLLLSYDDMQVEIQKFRPCGAIVCLARVRLLW